MNHPILPLCCSIGIAFVVTMMLCRRLQRGQRPLSASCALIGMAAGSFIATAMQRELYQNSFWSGERDHRLAIILIYLALHLIVNGLPAMGVMLAYQYAEDQRSRKIAEARQHRQSFSWARVITGGTIYTLFIGSMLFGLPPYGSWLTHKNLEFQMWRHTDAMELNHWAAQLLGQYGRDLDSKQFNGKSLPTGLQKVRSLGPYIRIRFYSIDTATEDCVMIYRDGKGPPLLLIGSSSFKPPAEFSNLHYWKPGIYIWSDD